MKVAQAYFPTSMVQEVFKFPQVVFSSQIFLEDM